jgi:hypothetical protein
MVERVRELVRLIRDGDDAEVEQAVLRLIGFALEAGATAAVKAMKMSARLAAGHTPAASNASLCERPQTRPA